MESFDYTGLQALYDRHVDAAGTVDYAALRADRTALDAVTDAFAAARPDAFGTDADRFAFWINAYNITCIRGVVDHYPTRSVRKIKPLFGFFTRIRFTVAGQAMTLYFLEHKLLRVQFLDARLHFAIVCASGSCPRLNEKVYLPETLDEQLESAAHEFLATPSRNLIDPAARRLKLSRIFKWYKGDFARDAGSVREYVARYVSADRAAFVRSGAALGYLRYDWTLNGRTA